MVLFFPPSTSLTFFSNLSPKPGYGVNISHLIRYVRAGSKYEQLIKRGMLLKNKLLDQEYQEPRLNHLCIIFAFVRMFYGRNNDLLGTGSHLYLEVRYALHEWGVRPSCSFEDKNENSSLTGLLLSETGKQCCQKI